MVGIARVDFPHHVRITLAVGRVGGVELYGCAVGIQSRFHFVDFFEGVTVMIVRLGGFGVQANRLAQLNDGSFSLLHQQEGDA